MALLTSVSVGSRNAMCDALVALIGAGAHVLIFTGSAPATPATADSGTLLCTLNMAATPFGAASSGVATAGTITSAAAVASGTAGYFRVKTSGGTVIFQGTCGTSGANMNFDNATVVSGGTVAITAMTLTVPQDGA